MKEGHELEIQERTIFKSEEGKLKKCMERYIDTQRHQKLRKDKERREKDSTWNRTF